MILKIFRVLSIFVLCTAGFSEVISPIEPYDYNENKANLGKSLFFDTRLNKNNFSCQRCHNLSQEVTGTTKNPFSSPSILNSSMNYYFDKEGKRQSLKEQIKDMFLDVKAYNTKPSYFIAQIKKNPIYIKQFKEIYGNINFENAIDAIEEFIKALRMPSRFDYYLQGHDDIFNEDEKEGYKLFIHKGCITCHNGANLGGGMLTYIKNAGSKNKMRTAPSLRNVAKTAPYIGNITNLKDTLRFLKLSVINVTLNEAEMDKIIIFLKTLDSEIPPILQH